MEVQAITRNARMSAAKGRPLARSCRGLKPADALKLVEFSPKKAAEILRKTLLSAIANARNNNGLDPDTLTVKVDLVERSTGYVKLRTSRYIELGSKARLDIHFLRESAKPDSFGFFKHN